MEALIGSRVTLAGKGPPGGVTAAVGKDGLDAVIGSRGWAVRLTMPREPTVVTLRDRTYKRLVVLEPRADSAPGVRLVLPLHDTTYQTVPRGRLVVEASSDGRHRARLRRGRVHGDEGRAGELRDEAELRRRGSLRQRAWAVLREAIDLDTMGLGPGTVLHIRAVAFDGNDVTGPGKGVSETRTLRIAEPDSVSSTPRRRCRSTQCG